jgi:SAM-dependent methyltransferase
MKRNHLHVYRAPGTLTPLEIARVEIETDEIREGVLRCAATGREFQIKDGAPHIINPAHMSGPMARDQEMIEQADRWADAQIAAGTFPEHLQTSAEAYARGLRANTELVLEMLKDAAPGRRLLEIGAGDTKLSARFARLGFEVFALDFAGYRICSTADRYMPESGYFERVVGLMAELPFADDAFDVVFTHATLHHALPLNHADFAWCNPANMAETLAEIGRVMKPRSEGGLLIIAGEGVYPDNTPIEARHYEAAAQQSGFYESWYEMAEYEGQFRATGVWPNLWTNQEAYRTFAHGYSDLGERVPLIDMDDGVGPETGALFLERAKRLRDVVPGWALGD